VSAGAQKFYNLTAEEVSVDSLLPCFSCSVPLGENWQDSVYSVELSYPEWIDMPQGDIAKYKALTDEALPATPVISQTVVTERKKASLEITFCPLVCQNGKYRILVSFMLDVKAKALKRSARKANARKASSKTSRYAGNSVLASGTWAKIRVSESGVYQLTESLIKKAGLSDLSKVKVYGYGGALQNETLQEDDLIALDDLKEVPLCITGGKRLFHAQGPVSWSSETATTRTRNPYSEYGYYFLTQSDDAPQTVDEETFLASFYPSAADYHSLYEIDNYAWFQGGRNLFYDDPIALGESKTYSLATPGHDTTGKITIGLTAGVATRAKVTVNDSVVGTINITVGSYDKGNETTKTYTIYNLKADNAVTVTTEYGGPVRLDYFSFCYATPAVAPDLSGGSFPTPEYVYNITNQNHHADGFADMVIIIPTSQKLLTQAERLKAFHEEHDSLSVIIVPADELYNEFSSGTPDANAYRRYLKMLYDRATTDDEMPKYLLLFGDCVWDNRMLTSDCSTLSPDDYLLCYESENSFNEVYCYVDDGWFCLLDDGEGGNPTKSDKLDMAVGRFPVSTEAGAKIMVDKTINYATNDNAGAWQNTLMFMGDDGNNNIHMEDVNAAAEDVRGRYPGYLIKKVMWDAYTRETSSTGYTYPDASKVIKQQQAAGALIMDYAGHGSEVQISHESVLTLNDFASFTNDNLPLWITASCDIMPFDGTKSTIGETAVLNEKGGAVAFFGTTRTVYARPYNKVINMAYLKYVLSMDGDRPMTLGEAQRLTKNELITTGKDKTENKLQYSLLGDPALSLNLPTLQVVVDSINGKAVSSGDAPTLSAGSVATVSGHVEGTSAFDGVVSVTVQDTEETITCKMNDSSTDNAFTYTDRTKTLFSGTDSVQGGKFSFTFAVPKDINYADDNGLMTFYAVNGDHTLIAHGNSDDFLVGGTVTENNDSIGPTIYCYLNTPSFTNGDKVNTTPFFVAEIYDADGINATGNGIGHDLELIIDGDMSKTYILNDNFTYDFGTYTNGITYYSIPELEEGEHTLTFRAWDVLNNSSTVTLRFVVVKGLEPTLFSVSCTNNPASTSTTFIINHDRTGSSLDVELDIFDLGGRHLWNYAETGVSSSGAYTVYWDLTVDGGRRLPTGVYLYRVRVSCDGSSKVSKAKKLIIIGNN